MKKIIILLLSIIIFTTTEVFATTEYEQAVNKLITIAINENGYLEKQDGNYLYDKTANVGTANYTKYAYDLSKNFYEGSV